MSEEEMSEFFKCEDCGEYLAVPYFIPFPMTRCDECGMIICLLNLMEW